MTLVVAEYIWIDHDSDLRSKTQTLNIFGSQKLSQDYFETLSYQELNDKYLSLIPKTYIDGSKINISFKKDIELVPTAICIDPLRKKYQHRINFLVLCSYFYNDDLSRNETCQKYTLLYSENTITSKNYYCGNGNGISRKIPEEHFQKCLFSKLNITGYNIESSPGQYAYYIKNTIHLIFAKFILLRICETHSTKITFDV